MHLQYVKQKKGTFNICSRLLVTLHSCGAELLPREEDSMVVIFGVPRVLLLLQEGPATHIFQTLRRVPQFNQTHGLEKERRKHTQ